VPSGGDDGYRRAQDRADRLVRAGVAVFVVGLVALAVILVPFFLGSDNRPTWLNVIAIIALPLGLGLALGGIVSSVRSPLPDMPEDAVTPEG
jgi:hypothetical protein